MQERHNYAVFGPSMTEGKESAANGSEPQSNHSMAVHDVW